jgi:hypothetical protein
VLVLCGQSLHPICPAPSLARDRPQEASRQAGEDGSKEAADDGVGKKKNKKHKKRNKKKSQRKKTASKRTQPTRRSPAYRIPQPQPRAQWGGACRFY